MRCASRLPHLIRTVALPGLASSKRSNWCDRSPTDQATGGAGASASCRHGAAVSGYSKRKLNAFTRSVRGRVIEEGERTAAHLRTVEDRAHQEVDRARQETKQWQLRLEAAERSHRDTAQVLEARCETSQRQLQKAEKEVARLSGQVSALETSLAKTSPSSKAKRIPRSTGSPKISKSK